MEVDVTKQNVTVNKLINAKKEIVTIDGDMIVPDIKPDILNTIDTVGNVCIYKKEVLDGKVRFDGSINLNVIYLADSETDITRGLTTTLDFTQMIDVDNCRNGMQLRNNIAIKDIECKVLNGRKINTKVVLEIDVYIYSNEEVNILKEINNVDDVQILNAYLNVNNLVGTGCCRASAKDTIALEAEDNIAEILKTEVNLINSEMKLSYNKVLLKADACVKIMYLTENENIKVVSCNIPVMGFVDMPNVSEENLLSCQYEIKNILIKPNSAEQHSLYIEVEFEICCDATQSMEIKTIQDLYCPNADLEFKQKEINTIANNNINKNICNIQERISIPEISNNKIYDVEIVPNINNAKVLNGSIFYDGDLKLNFIFSSNNTSGINTKRYSLPFTYNVVDENITTNKTINTSLNCINDQFIITSDGIMDCKIDLEFETRIYEEVNLNLIEDVKIRDENNNDNPSIIVYIVKEGDTIWDIAKKYRTTMQDIININNLDNGDEIFIGEKLFIPRYYSNRIA